jgi:hypothetical protein
MLKQWSLFLWAGRPFSNRQSTENMRFAGQNKADHTLSQAAKYIQTQLWRFSREDKRISINHPTSRKTLRRQSSKVAALRCFKAERQKSGGRSCRSPQDQFSPVFD